MRPWTRRRLSCRESWLKEMMGQVALDVEMPEAGDHVLASYHSEQECPVVITE